MTPNPLHGAIDETQPHSTTEGGVSEKPTMREALEDIAARAECTDDDDFRCDLEDRLKTIAEVARAALAAEEESGWRTMDSAPKDGTPFLAYFPDDGETEMVHWSAALDPKFSADDGWMVYRSEQGWPICAQFSHWMPLPAPPSPKSDTP